MCADDISIVLSGVTLTCLEQVLNNAINKFSEWCARNMLIISNMKTQNVIFNKKKITISNTCFTKEEFSHWTYL